MVGQHIFCRLKSDETIAKTIAQRRVVAATVFRHGRKFGLLGFGVADTHLQMSTAGNDQGNEFARRVESALTQRFRLAHGFNAATVVEIEKQWHLHNSLAYDLRQVIHHGIHASDPFFEGSNLPDLLGLRVIGRYTRDHVSRHLPRLRPQTLLELLGLSRLEPDDGPLEQIVAAAAATIGSPDNTLRGNSSMVVSARRAVIEVVGRRLSTTQIASLLGVHRTTVTRLGRLRASRRHVAAVRLQLGLWRSLSVPGRATR